MFRIIDSCNDGVNNNYRFFEYDRWLDGDTVAGGNASGVWPAAGRVFITDGFGLQNQHRLSCTAGKGVCFGAIRRDSSDRSTWGTGIEGDKECENCCVRCPASGEVTYAGGNLVCTTSTPPIPDPDVNPLDDFNVTISSSCRREVRICLRDHQCEDGDRVQVSVNGSVVFSGELLNAASCVNAPVRQGSNSISMLALNGTGFKGNCSFADSNTGEIQIFGNNNVQTQTWSHRGGAGSRANLVVNIESQTTNCSLGTQMPTGPPGADFRITDNCNDGSSIQYKFFQYDRWHDGNTVAGQAPSGVWPSSNRAYLTPLFGQPQEHNLSCTAGKGICFGASVTNNPQRYWGAGIEGNEGCTSCCVRCPTSGRVRFSGGNLVCP